MSDTIECVDYYGGIFFIDVKERLFMRFNKGGNVEALSPVFWPCVSTLNLDLKKYSWPYPTHCIHLHWEKNTYLKILLSHQEAIKIECAILSHKFEWSEKNRAFFEEI